MPLDFKRPSRFPGGMSHIRTSTRTPTTSHRDNYLRVSNPIDSESWSTGLEGRAPAPKFKPPHIQADERENYLRASTKRPTPPRASAKGEASKQTAMD